ncbi:polysaccharide biosynthesis protein, partial [Planctomycetota bacterium]
FISTMILVLGRGAASYVPHIKTHVSLLFYVPYSVMLLDWGGTVVMVCGVRLAIRLYYEETETKAAGRLTRLLIVGAGNAGEVLMREIHRKPEVRYEVVGFIDDDPKKQGVRIHGISVLGNTDQIKEIAQDRNIDEIVIAMPSATHKQMRQVVKRCEGTKLRFSTVPDLVEIASGKVSVSQIRNVDINDLLGREPVKLDDDLISGFINNKVVAITGAGGSIGAEMCRQVMQYGPKRLLLIEQAENALFDIGRELESKFGGIEIQSCICDIIDRKRLEALFERYGPEVVIHAAAHKHVPLMELNPGEAIKNNVRGTQNIAAAADKYHVKHFLMISTDKAVNPTSIMGSSKRLAEMLIQSLNQRSKTNFVMVRFGNVLGSNGSVLPIFQRQIAQGGPVTVTHPEMRRYFMTIPEASQLVLQAAAMGQGGEIFVLDMGEPVKIADLARELITLSGFRVGEDIEIEFSGIRPGEKLFEELATTGENMQPTRHPKISIWKNVPPEEKILQNALDKLLPAADRGDRKEIIQLIKEIVPEYIGDVDSIELHAEYQAKSNNQVAE